MTNTVPISNNYHIQLRRYEEHGDSTEYVGQEQLYGRIVRATYAEGIVVQLSDGREYRLPPESGLPDGTPRLLTMWTVHEAGGEESE